MKIKILKEAKKKKTKVSKPGQKRVSKKIAYFIDKEKMDPKQAAAVAYSMEERGELKKGGKHSVKEEQLEEMSSVGGGSVQGYAGSPLASKEDNEEFNKSEKNASKLKGKKLAEMFSSSAQMRIVRIRIASAEKEQAGHVERSQHQGLRNVMREDDDDTEPLQGFDSSRGAGQGTVWKLSDFADNSRNVSRVFSVLKDIEDNIGLEKLKTAVLKDISSMNRISVMSNKFGYNADLYERIENNDIEAIKKYYQFLINEFLFWISYNPMSSAQQYAGRHIMLSKPTKDLAYAHIYRYVSDPNQNNPRDLGDRISKQADFYELEKDLDPALYDLPEE